jgi:hypothetical protein
MLRPVPAIWLLLVFLLIVGVNAFAYWKHLYFYVPWLDIPMHFVSGGWLAMVAISLIATHPRLSGLRADRVVAFWLAIGTVMLFSVIWELFEFRLDPLIAFAPHDLEDTLSDLLFDLLGGISGSLVVLLMRYTKRNV